MTEYIETLEFKYEDSRYKLDGKVAVATILMGIRRGFLKSEARTYCQNKDNGILDDEGILRIYTLPDLISGTIEFGGTITLHDDQGNDTVEPIQWPLSFETLSVMPEQAIVEWQDKLYALNPHWLPGYTSPESKKKAEIK